MTNHKKNFGGFTHIPTLALFNFCKTFLSKMNIFSEKGIFVKCSDETKKLRQSWCRGFTLVEMIVSVGLFTMVLFIASSAFLAVLNADRKSRATRIAIDNLNLALEDMSRRIKTGTTYNCGGGITGVSDCVAPGRDSVAFTEQDGATRTIYKHNVDGKFIERVRDGITLRVTAPEIEINRLQFFVGGNTDSPNNFQPYVVINIDGKTIGTITSDFIIQTIATQRAYGI